MTFDYLKTFLVSLGFGLVNGQKQAYVKKFDLHNNYELKIDLDGQNTENSKINWGSLIKVKRTTTSNFSQEETLVVLECVNRLLDKGYKPEDIILEDSWKLGHKGKGFLDISVKKEGQTFLMIECKTWGKEYDKELKNLYQDGGQLLSYFQQDKSAQYLALYTSKFENNQIEYKNDIIIVEQTYRETNNLKDLFERWNKITSSNGIFEEWIKSYHFENRTLIKKDINPLTEEDSRLIFHGFASILRRHSVSDKPNAFNKIFNLFLAKIFDEKKRDTEELDFQWREGNPKEDEVEFEIRLINLYKGGMDEFLKKEVDGISDEMFRTTNPQELKENKRKVLRLDSVFKIKEVHDEETFMDNFRVLKDVVLLLEKYQIRYPRKQRHLSDFFELLLTTGLKQESGQFFTPPAVAKFIVKSLPFEAKIEEKLKAGNTSDLLPNVIDYACGSGHFLTESMEETQRIIDSLEVQNLKLYPAVEEDIEIWKRKKYDWAAKHIYGIEKDNRLVKVAKVGCYFYGDGLAQVIHGDGLDSFTDSKSYRGLLKKEGQSGKDNPKFDFILANPPYSVDNFKLDLKNKDENSFELYKYLTDNSSEIEVLFIERTKQLLASGGVAGVILPSSILSNTGLYTKARELLLKYFEIKAIAEFGSNTFMATGTNTIILFLKKRENADNLVEEIKTHIQKALDTKQDLTINGVADLFSKYVKNGFVGAGFNLPVDGVVLSYFEYLEKNFTKEQIELEKEKILYFALAYPQKIVLVNTGEKDEEKKFLGYYFSNRRGHEGIKPFVAGKTIDQCTYLYDENDLFNPQKASSYIQKAFAGELDNLEIDPELQKNVSLVNLASLLDFESKKFEKIINTRSKKKLKIESQWEVVKLGEVCNEIINGGTPSKDNSEYWNSKDVKWLTTPDFKDDELFLSETSQFVSQKAVAENKTKIVPKNSVLLTCTATIGKVCINKVELTTNQQINGIVCNEKIQPEYLANYLKAKKEDLESLTNNSGVNHVNLTMLRNFPVILPPLQIQTQIVTEIEKIESQGQKAKAEIENLKTKINELVEKAGGKEIKIEEIATMLKRGKSPEYGVSSVQVIKSGQARGIKEFDFSKKYFVTKDFILDERKLQKGDLLINSTGVGTAGRVTLFDLEGDFVVDSHITILRVKENLAIPDYVLQCFIKIGFKEIENMARGQSGQIELNLDTISNIKIALPSLQIQEQIVYQIQKIEKKIENLNQTLDSVKTQKKAVLKKYL